MKKIISKLLLLIAFVSARGDATFPETPFWPMAIGNKWLYEFEGNLTSSIVNSSFSLVGSGYIGWLYIGSSTDSATILAWTLLMLTCIWFVFRGGSEVVTYDGARWLMPINSGSTIRVDGEELIWKEGRIFTEKIENETITLSVERISGVYFLVLSNSINFNIRKDPLLKNNYKSVKKRAIALMQSNSSKVGSWPSWALDESEEE